MAITTDEQDYLHPKLTREYQRIDEAVITLIRCDFFPDAAIHPNPLILARFAQGHHFTHRRRAMACLHQCTERNVQPRQAMVWKIDMTLRSEGHLQRCPAAIRWCYA